MFFRPLRDTNWAAAAKETAGRRANEFRWEDFHAAAAAFGLAAGYTRNDVNVAFRRLACKAHPDTGGTHEAFQTLVEHRDRLLSHAAF